MRTKKNLLLLAFVMTCSAVAAQQRTERAMSDIASKKLSEMSGKLTRSTSSLAKVMDKEELCIYADGSNGFVVVSKDKAFNEVLGYSSTAFDESNMPCGLKWWIDETDRSLSHRLRAGKVANNSVYYEPVAQLVTSKWGQSEPFNLLCPDISGTKPPCGCVATAMAQIMNYFKYPQKSTGNGYYYIGASQSKVPVVLNTEYKWDEMKDVYTYSTIDAPGCRAVAELMADAGAGANMQYTLSGSGSNSFSCAAAFANNFGYDPYAVKLALREYYSDEEWMNIIYTSLLNRIPVYYAGTSPNEGGHAFLFDGIDEDGNVHVNWGWDGTSDGFYNINNLSPSGIFGPGTTHFTQNHSMVYGFKCQPKPDEDEEYHSLIGTDAELAFKSIMPKSITVDVEAIYNLNFSVFDGVVNVVVKSVDAPSLVYEKVMFSTTESGKLAPGYGWRTGEVFWRINDLKQGNYVVYLESKDVNEKTPSFVRSVGGSFMYPITVSSTGSITFGKPEPTAIDNLSTIDTAKSSIKPSAWLLDGTPVDDISSHRGIVIIRDASGVRKVLNR